jgi:predicted nuclease of predicted toxin-antitoxin system
VKLLFDQNLSFRLCRLLADVCPDASQVKLVGLEAADDGVIWAYAARHGFAIATLDADFADIAALRGAPPKVIWLRCGNQPTQVVAQLLRDHATQIEAFLKNDEAACLELY